MRHINFLVFTILLLSSCTTRKPEAEITDLTRYVDPFIGTGYHGHVFLGANVPFGAVQVGPTRMGQTN